MYCSQLLKMDKISDEQRKIMDGFLKKCLPDEFITVSQAKEYTQLSEKIIIDIFSQLYLNGYLNIVYVIRCPECGHLIKKTVDIHLFDYESIDRCYACGEQIHVDENAIVILYNKRSDKLPFVRGQRSDFSFQKMNGENVAQIDTLSYHKEISSYFARICKLEEMRYEQELKDKEKNSEVIRVKDRAYEKYKKNKMMYKILKGVSFLVSLLILIFVLLGTKASASAAVIVNVVIYTALNIIDFIIKCFINMDLIELEKDELLKAKKEECKVLNMSTDMLEI